MDAVFLNILNQSIAASWLILAVIALRFCLKKAPKRTICLLWAIVALRLLCPLSIESALSLIPSAKTFDIHNVQTEIPQVQTGFSAVNNAINPVLAQSFPPNPTDSVNPLAVWIFAAGAVWVVGAAAMLLYSAVSYLRVRRSVQAAVPAKGNIWLCDSVKSPFILGLFRPKIFLPSDLEPAAAKSVIAHERAHLTRRDHLWKPLGFLILSIHWFNPLCWLAYGLLCRDIELACDEKVIRNLNMSEKKAYSTALLECSVQRLGIAACPLAFGEVGVKERVRTVLHYRKPAAWLAAIGVVACAVLACCFLTDPIQAEQPEPLPQAGTAQQVSVTATVTANVPLRTAPSENSVIFSYLESGQQVLCQRVENISGTEWVYLSYQNLFGWIPREFVDAVPGAVPSQSVPVSSDPSISFPVSVDIRSAPSPMSRIVATLEPGTEVTVQRVESVAGTPWLYIQCPSQNQFGWITDFPGVDALKLFYEYTAAFLQQTPDEAEKYLCFSSDAEREFFRDNYTPTQINGSFGFSQPGENLWAIRYSDGYGYFYSFVGKLDGQLYVFQNVSKLPDALTNGLDLTPYALADEYMPVDYEAYSIAQRLMAFAQPVGVTIDGPKPQMNNCPRLNFADLVGSTDTWESALTGSADTWKSAAPSESPSGTTIVLTAADGATASLNSCHSEILISADGITTAYSCGLSGETMVAMIYNWAEQLQIE